MYKISGGKRLKEFLKTALEHNLSVLISGPPGCGKSLPPDEKVVVITKAGDPAMSVPIVDVKEGDKVIGLDVNNRAKVTDVKRKVAFEHGGDLLVVKTRSGRVVRATPDHSFLALDTESGKFVPCKGSDLKVGDIIPGFRCHPNDLGILVEEANGFKLDFGLGYVLGFYLSEGNIGKPYRVVFSSEDPGSRAALTDYLNRFGRKACVYKSSIQISNEKLYQLVREFGCGARNKKIPSWVLVSPPEFKTGLISGYLDGDGYLGVGVEAGSMSHELIENLSVLMASLGIGSSVFLGGMARWSGREYGRSKRLYVFDRDLLFERIPFHKKLQVLRKTEGHSTHDIVMFPKRLIDRIGKDLHVYRNEGKLKRIFRRFKHKMYNKKMVTRNGALNWIKVMKDNGLTEVDETTLLNYVQSPIMFERIVEIEKVPYKGLVYDLETDTHNFLTSQGIFVHNSEITTQAATELDMPVDELRLYLMEPGEAKGLPDIRGDATYWTRPDWLPVNGKRVLFFDDIHLASEQLQSPLFELLLCHRLHGHETSAETRFVAAGNLSLHSAGASELLAPVMDRFDVAVEFSPTVEDFIQYATSRNVSSKISAFLLAYPEYLYDPDPSTSQKFHSPRSWFSLHRVLTAGYDIRVAVGVVGINAGTKFVDSYPILGKSINDLLKSKPESVKDQVVIAAALSRHKPNVKVLDFVAKKLNAEAQMCYVMGEMAFNFDEIYKLADHPTLSKITDELIKKMEGK
ncbi:hypothetical protein DRO59_07030 [Candidatus Bathyarchaeota archaeon]|nr:MAG: hypothetical protein DRO59_07030 [Candidatus Bathyarchaeota archaeon]